MNDRSLGSEQSVGFASSLHAERMRLLEAMDESGRALDAIRAARSDGTADDEHDPEGSTLSSDWSHIAGLNAEHSARLESIDAALDRIGAGTYGDCLSCAKPIPLERLRARPSAEHCVDCARAVEARRR